MRFSCFLFHHLQHYLYSQSSVTTMQSDILITDKVPVFPNCFLLYKLREISSWKFSVFSFFAWYIFCTPAFSTDNFGFGQLVLCASMPNSNMETRAVESSRWLYYLFEVWKLSCWSPVTPFYPEHCLLPTGPFCWVCRVMKYNTCFLKVLEFLQVKANQDKALQRKRLQCIFKQSFTDSKKGCKFQCEIPIHNYTNNSSI